MAGTPQDLGTERIGTLLARYAVPAIIAMASMSLYNIIDSVFIGHAVGGGAMALSGLAIAMPLMNISAAFGSMVGIGAAATVSINLGEGKRERTFHILGNQVLLNLIIGASLTVLSLFFLDDLLIMFGASEYTLPPARDFMQVIFGGCIVHHMFWGFNEMMRASGYPQRAMGLMLLTVVLTCAFNALFLFVFEWGVRGSAFATVLAQAVALGLAIAHFSSRKSFLHFRRGIFRLRRRMVGGILSIGVAPFLVNFCSSIVVIFVNRALAANGGDLYSGGYGVMNRVVMLFIMICAGFNQGMQPIVGFNYGARNFDRVVSTLRITIFWAVGVMTVAFLAGELIPEQIAQLFVKRSDPDAPMLVEISGVAMRYVMMFFPIVGFQIVTTNFFQYIGKAPKAITLSLTRQMLFLLPLLLLLPRSMGATGVWISFPIADAVATALAAVLLWRQLRKFRAG
ncbi:MAG: MATE family efflux transporter [Alistipes sp.]|jgi:putative MATE family efflux protein|nr:MATE family efflux transporter [Alistipes sp.]